MSSAVLRCSNAIDVDVWLGRCFSALRQKLEHFLRMFLSKLCTPRHMFGNKPKCSCSMALSGDQKPVWCQWMFLSEET
jgi:hypothetical protein